MKDLNKALVLEKEKLDSLRESYHKLGDKITRQHKKWEMILGRIHAKKLASKLDWKFLLSAEHDTSVKHSARHAALQKLGLMSSGYVKETNQAVIKIGLYKNNKKKNKITINGLKKILPYIRPRKTEKAKVISIFEQHLSITGSYYLEIKGIKARIVKYVYGRKSIILKWTKLDTALEYIKNNLWYEEN